MNTIDISRFHHRKKFAMPQPSNTSHRLPKTERDRLDAAGIEIHLFSRFFAHRVGSLCVRLGLESSSLGSSRVRTRLEPARVVFDSSRAESDSSRAEPARSGSRLEPSRVEPSQTRLDSSRLEPRVRLDSARTRLESMFFKPSRLEPVRLRLAMRRFDQ